MFKFILGAVTVVVLIGYGIVTTDDLERAGDTTVRIINDAATYVKERTDPTLVERITDEVRN